jgi:hypothetical protein
MNHFLRGLCRAFFADRAPAPPSRPVETLEFRRLLSAESPAATPAETPPSVGDVIEAPLVLDDFRPDDDGSRDYEVDGRVRLPGGQELDFTADANVTRIESGDSTTILEVTLGPVDLDLLGVRLDLQRVALEVAITPGEGQVLGNVLSELLLQDEEAALDAIVEPLNDALGTAFAGGDSPFSTLAIDDALEDISLTPEMTDAFADGSLLDRLAPPESAGLRAVEETVATPIASEPTLPEEVRVLSLSIGELDLNLLGLRVQTLEPVDLSVTAAAGQGKLLGNLFVGLSSLLDPLLPTNQVPTPLPASSDNVSSMQQMDEELVPIVGLTLGDVNLNLLGLDANLNVDLLVALDTGPGNVLGSLLLSELNQIEDEVLAGGFDPLRRLLGFLFDGNGVMSDAMPTEAAALRAAPEANEPPMFDSLSLLDLSIDQLDLDLLGVIVRSEGISLELRANPGPGALLGNLVARLVGGFDTPDLAPPAAAPPISGPVDTDPIVSPPMPLPAVTEPVEIADEPEVTVIVEPRVEPDVTRRGGSRVAMSSLFDEEPALTL